jgi:peptidoglycan/xylan/chitin deacetylase (PgdA/CDA1 family)
MPTWKICALVALLAACTSPATAQMKWPEGRTAAIVLTYDDALQSQLQFVLPQLAETGLHGTFFLEGANVTPADMRRWREVQRAGHELGNHSLFHPCPKAMLPDRTQYYAENYDARRLLDELAVMNDVLFGIDGEQTRTFSVPCSQMLMGGVDYTEALRHAGLVKYVRNGGDQYQSVITDFRKLDFFNVPSWGPVDGPDGAQLIAYAQRVAGSRALGVFQFHGVGGDYLSVSADAHHELVRFLKSHPEIWVGTFQQVLDYVATHSR